MNEEAKKTGRPAAGIEVQQRESVLLEMGKALRATAIYPAGHPQRAHLLSQAYAGIQGVLKTQGDLSFQTSRSGFVYNEIKIAQSQPLAQELAREMHLRQVKSFSLRRELTLDDFTAFLEMLLEDPEEFRKGRLIEQWIRSRQIQTVWVNEIDFSKLVTTTGTAEETEQDDAGPGAEPQLEELLARLEEETDPERCGRLLRELEVLTRALLEGKDFEGAWRVVLAISLQGTEELRPGSANEQVRALAAGTVRALVKGAFLRYLLERYSAKQGRDRVALHRLLMQVGPSVIDEVVAFLARRESISALRPLMEVVLSFGGRAREVLEGYLRDPDLARVRRATALLGELRDRHSVEAVRKLLGHRDDKVRREAIRALLRIRGMEASRALAAALQQEADPEIRIMIVAALGEARDLAGVPALIKLLKGTPVREDTVSLLEAVIEALGKIGSKEALPHLIKTLNHWSLLKREPLLKLRIKAALSLGRMGGESAMQSLARYARGAGPLHQTCAAVLEALVANDGKPVENVEGLVK